MEVDLFYIVLSVSLFFQIFFLYLLVILGFNGPYSICLLLPFFLGKYPISLSMGSLATPTNLFLLPRPRRGPEKWSALSNTIPETSPTIFFFRRFSGISKDWIFCLVIDIKEDGNSSRTRRNSERNVKLMRIWCVFDYSFDVLTNSVEREQT